MQVLHCGRCGTRVAFEALHCPRCWAELGYQPTTGRMLALRPGGPRTCANRCLDGLCNWLLEMPENGQGNILCRSCRMTSLVPDLGRPGNLQRWAALERTKRRLLCTLLRLGLEPAPLPLQFRFLESLPGEPAVPTAHTEGVVTVNIAEADDAHRLQLRQQHGEPQRTLLGHLRHEVAHHLQHAWVAGNATALARCREVFGDERAHYAQALAQHHHGGPPAHWADHHISAYASAHPWEDWAETCAHLLLVNEAVHTARAWQAEAPLQQLRSLAYGVHGHTTSLQDPAADRLAKTEWLPLASFLNEMSAALGTEAAYPFALPPTVLHKMRTVQELLARAAW